MSALTIARKDTPADGLMRSARLMRALGPDAAPIWAELSKSEVQALTAAMDTLGPSAEGESDAVSQFMTAHRRLRAPANAGASVWRRLSDAGTDTLARLFADEHAQTVALILSRLEGEASARLLRALPPKLAIDAMQRLLNLGPVHPAALAALETQLDATLKANSGDGQSNGHERVARIFDRLDSRSEKTFLAALDHAEPGAGEKVRALMFTFDDLTGLDAAGLQTLLSAADRAVLVVALKGARPDTAAVFFANMTQRAGDLLREEIAALGPVRRSEIEGARQELVALARTLMQRGDIRADGQVEDDELVD
ncbi:FliG C-terminal domain-containing protein [uncultured Hyphomonas sp.]|uniref:flagellar motor switch protein FliG n=1 Tax=uncultured Hyphomonas sp. TaxID=225298 RepID=UPI002AAB2E67|nr:FliG C-terminal domain-containing protein [uncultured Hyphomonas sp.]